MKMGKLHEITIANKSGILATKTDIGFKQQTWELHHLCIIFRQQTWTKIGT
jgi:hypothetical protein